MWTIFILYIQVVHLFVNVLLKIHNKLYKCPCTYVVTYTQKDEVGQPVMIELYCYAASDVRHIEPGLL